MARSVLDAMLELELAHERLDVMRRCHELAIETFLPPSPPEATPTAIALPPPPMHLVAAPEDDDHGDDDHGDGGRVSERSQPFGVTLVDQEARPHHRHGTRYTFELHNNGVNKHVSCTHKEFQQLVELLRAEFPHQLEDNYVVDTWKIGFWKFQRVVAQSAQDVLRTLRQLLTVPEVLDHALFHRFLDLSDVETSSFSTLAAQMREESEYAMRMHALLLSETERYRQRQDLASFEIAETICAKYFLAMRYVCTEPLRQPLLAYDHEMVFDIWPPKLSHRTRVVTGPGGHKYFRVWRKGRLIYLTDMFGNDVAQIELAPPQLPQSSCSMYLVIRRAFPACRQHQMDGQKLHFLPCFILSYDARTAAPAMRFSIRALPLACGFTSLGHISVAWHGTMATKQTATGQLELTARDNDGFTFFLGELNRGSDPIQLLVHPGQDIITLLTLGLAMDTLLDARRR